MALLKSRAVSFRVAQGCGERNVQLESAGSAKRGLKDGPADTYVLVIAYWFSRLVPATVLWKQRFAVGESDLCSEVKKFTAKRRPETTLPTWTSAAGL